MRSNAQRRGAASQANPDAAERNGSTRRFKPRPHTVVRPSFVSQDTSFVLLSVGGRKYLESIVPLCSRVSRIGKTVLVELDEAERVVRSLARNGVEPVEHDDDQPQTADQVLALLGKEIAR